MIKNNKEKVFELKIQEDDEMSGIDSISLVDDPAIEIHWVAFKKEPQIEEHNFHIPENEDETYLEQLTPFGQDEQELFDDGFEIETIEYVKKKDFTSSNPNAKSELDGPNVRIRYKYVLNPAAGGSPIIDTTRYFCKELINKNLVFRIEDMLAQRNDFGQSFADWRGGYNCRHLFAKIKYTKKGYIPNNASGKDEEGYDILGYTQNDTRTKNPSFAKQDNNPCWEGYEQIGTKMINGKEVPNCDPIKKENMENISDYPESIKNNAKAVLKWVDENGWGSCGTSVGKQRANQLANGEAISEDTVKRMYSYLSRHKGDLDSSKGYGDGCGKLMYDSWGGLSALSWAESKVKSFAKQEFEKISIDYDGTLSTTKGELLAKQLISQGNDVYIVTARNSSDSTPVNAIADKLGIPHSKIYYTNGKSKWMKLNELGIKKHIDNNPNVLEDIKKHLPLIKTQQFEYNVGGLPPYVDQLPKKKKSYLEEFEYLLNKEQMSKQYFAADNEKHIVLGPAMIPDQKIFRKDSMGNPYYVYFSTDTIKMIADKYMKNKYTDNNDMMHDGEAVPDVFVVESWIKESNNDKSTDYGFEKLPVGTWFVSMKINNPDIWSKVKEHQLNGFSVSGYFEEVASFKKEELFLYKVAELLKNIED